MGRKITFIVGVAAGVAASRLITSAWNLSREAMTKKATHEFECNISGVDDPEALAAILTGSGPYSKGALLKAFERRAEKERAIMSEGEGGDHDEEKEARQKLQLVTAFDRDPNEEIPEGCGQDRTEPEPDGDRHFKGPYK